MLPNGSSTIASVRSQSVLRAAVEEYITSAEPVASRTLNRQWLPISSASIRAVMAELTRDGLLFQPHTSAGRIPTDLGYRVYVDDLMPRGVPGLAAAGLDLNGDASLRRRLRLWAETLAGLTGLTAFALALPRDDARHRHIELIRLRSSEVLVIFATWDGGVRHRVVQTIGDVSQPELDRFANFLDERLAGKTTTEVRAQIRAELDGCRETYTTLRRRAFELAQAGIPADEPEVLAVVGGQHHLLGQPEFSSADVLRPILAQLEQGDTWEQLLTATLRATEGVTVLIGEENQPKGLQACAVVAVEAPWDDGIHGTVGLVGPTRIRYATVVATLQLVRQRVTDAMARRRASA